MGSGQEMSKWSPLLIIFAALLLGMGLGELFELLSGR
jgi:hypothetical protein